MFIGNVRNVDNRGAFNGGKKAIVLVDIFNFKLMCPMMINDNIHVLFRT